MNIFMTSEVMVFGAYGVLCLLLFFILKRAKRDQNLRKAAVLPIHSHQENDEKSANSLIGADRYGRRIELSDKAANQHTLVLGTTGSGKTVTVCNIVESAIHRDLPLIYIDGKGDYDLARRVAEYGEKHGRPVSVFAMNGESVVYNPLASGGFTSKKDRIIELREWSEEHYKKLAEGYLQSVFKVMEACNVPCNMVSLTDHLDLKRLKALVRTHEAELPDAQRLMDELNHQDHAAKSIESLVAEIRNFTASEIGHLFDVDSGKPVLTLADVVAQNGIAYFCLPALEFPSMAQQLSHGEKKKLYVVFDEFSVFAGQQVLNVINMGRSAGVHAVLSTQSLSDLAVGRSKNADHFVNQVVGSCNTFILHRQNSPEDAAKLAELMGTRNTLEYTAHPDEIKALKTGEAFFYSKEDNKVRKINVRRSKI